MNTPDTTRKIAPAILRAVAAIDRAVGMLDSLEVVAEMPPHRDFFSKKAASATRTAVRRVRACINRKALREARDANSHLEDAFSQPFSEGKVLRGWAKSSLLDARAALLAPFAS